MRTKHRLEALEKRVDALEWKMRQCEAWMDGRNRENMCADGNHEWVLRYSLNILTGAYENIPHIGCSYCDAKLSSEQETPKKKGKA